MTRSVCRISPTAQTKMGDEGSTGTRRLAESRRTKRGDSDALPAQIPDLSDFMTDRFFFGDAVRYPPKPSPKNKNVPDVAIPSPNPNPNPNPSKNNRNSLRTQEWLEEARQIVAQSPARRSVDGNASIINNSFHQHLSRSGRHSFAESPQLQRNDRLSTSGRKTSAEPKFSSTEPSYYSTPNSFAADQENARKASTSQSYVAPRVEQWFANIIKKGASDSTSEEHMDTYAADSRSSRPPRLPRNQADESGDQKKRRDRKGNEAVTLMDVLKSSKVSEPHVTTANGKGRRESERASVGLLSPPRRSTSGPLQSRHGSHTPSIRATPSARSHDVASLNDFLRKQRAVVASGPTAGRHFKFILSAPVSTTSSMVAALCYAWMLGNLAAPPEVEVAAVPVMNVKRRQMWSNRQAAWLFHYVGIDGRALLFSDEVDIKRFAHPKRHDIVLIGQNEFNTNNNDEVVSPCTLLIDQYYGQAHELLQAHHLRKLLLAGVLLDTEIVYERTKLKDAQAIDLLLVGESPSYKNNFLSLLNQKHTDESFEQVLQFNYGEPLTNGKSQAPLASSSSGKNIISQTFSRWFGFGSK